MLSYRIYLRLLGPVSCLTMTALFACSGFEGDGSSSTGAGASTSTSTGAPSGTDTGATAASSSSSSSAAAGGGGGEGSGGSGQCTDGGPTIETQGDNGKLLLKGTVLTPDGPIDGEVYIEGNTIACVAASCSARATGATVIETHGIISPGLIDAHNHALFDVFDESDWTPTQTYANHDAALAAPGFVALRTAKQYLDGEDRSPFDLACEMDKYGEMKGLIAGTTSIVAAPGISRGCYASLARTIDTSANDLPADKVQTSTTVPSSTSIADGVCTSFTSNQTNAYLVHVAEGVDTGSKDEFDQLGTISTVDGCLYDSRTTIVQGTALGDGEMAQMGVAGMGLVWSPRSNVSLYGGGTDLTKTTDIQLALTRGVSVSIAPDWSIGGSQNILDELRFAHQVDSARWGTMFNAKTLFEMVTIHPALALHVSEYVGTIEVGKRADIAVFRGDVTKPYDSILAATPREVTAVFVDGRLLYGDAALEAAGPANATCESLDVCCRPKVACVAETTGTATDKLAQTLAEFSQAISDALVAYDALGRSDVPFSPIAPLVKCN